MASATAEKPPDQKDQRGPVGSNEAQHVGESLRGVNHIRRLDEECKILEGEIEVRRRQLPEVSIKRNYFWTILGIYIFLATTVLATSILFIVYNQDLHLYGLSLRHIGMIGILIVLAHFLMSVGSVRLDEWAGLTFFNQPVWVYTEAGFAFPIWGVLRLVTEPRVTYQNQFPGKPEAIVRIGLANAEKPGDVSEKYNPGEVRPIFATTGLPTLEEQAALKLIAQSGLIEESAVLFKQFTVEFRFSVFYRVDNQFVFDRVIPGDTPQQRRAQIVDRLREIGEAELKEIVRQLTPATVIQCWEMIGKRLCLRLRKIALDWGVWIDRATLAEQNLSHETNKKQAAAIQAAFDKISELRKSEGQRYNLAQLGAGRGEAKAAEGEGSGKALAFEGEGRGKALSAEGHGEASAKLAILKARAAGYKKIAEELDMSDKQVAMLADLAERVASNAQFGLFGSAGVADLMASVSAIKTIPGISPKPATGPDKPPTV